MKSLRNLVRKILVCSVLVTLGYCGGRNTGNQNSGGIVGSGNVPNATASGQTADYSSSPGGIYTFVGWDASTTSGQYPDKMTIRCASVLDPVVASAVAGTYTGNTSVSATSFGAIGEGLGGISVLNTGTQNSSCIYDTNSGTANLSAGNAVTSPSASVTLGFPASTTVATVTNATQITLGTAATGTATSVAFTANGATKFGDITNTSTTVSNVVSAGLISGIDVDPIDSSGKNGIKVFYEAAQISDQTREYGLQLQYECNGSGTYALVPGSTDFRSSDAQVGASTTYKQMGPYSLPAACDNNTAVKLRWRYYSVSGSAGSRTRIAIRNIRVSSDATAPTFSGLTTATASDYQTVNLTWPAASDDVTTASYIRYDIYQATASGAYGTAGYGTQPVAAYTIRGTTSATINNLNPSTTYFFVIRARDEQGNKNATGAINTGSETERTVTTPADMATPVVSTIFPANSINASTTTTTIPVTFNVAMDPTTLTLASNNFQVKAGSDCTGTALTGASIVASNSNKTWTLTLNGGQLTAGNFYTTCLTSSIRSAGNVAFSAYSATWKAVTGTSLLEGFESWATANQPTGWVCGGTAANPPGVLCPNAGVSATSITQDTTTPKEGTRAANITATTSANGNMLTYGSNLSGANASCTRLGLWVRGSSTAKAIALQLSTSSVNYCNFGAADLATSFSTATAVNFNSTANYGAAMDTAGAWRAVVCVLPSAYDTIRFRGGSASDYNMSFDGLEYLDDNNNPCIPVDTTAPTTGTAISFGTVTTTSIVVNWGAATDSVTAQASLQYRLVKDTSSTNIDTIAKVDVISGGNLLVDYGTNTLTNTASGLTPSTTYYFAVVVRDAAGNKSLYSVASQTSATPDSTAPAAISTLAAGTITSSSIVLNWTAVGDDASSGTAASYAIRYASGGSCPFTDGNFGSTGTLVGSPPTPQAAGNSETKTVTGLTPSTQYWFAIKVSDEVPNTSTISNCLTATTNAGGAPFNVSGVQANGSASTGSTIAVTYDAVPTAGAGSTGAENTGNYKVVLGTGACTDTAIFTVSAASLTGSVATVTTSGWQANGYSYKMCVSNVTRQSDGDALTTNSVNFSGKSLVISQMYVNGGSAGATYINKFIELFNPNSFAITIPASTWSLQYAASGSTTNFSGLFTLPTAVINPGKYFLVQASSNGAVGAALPTPDATSTINQAGAGGKVALVTQTAAINSQPALPATTVLDFLGYGTANWSETAAATVSTVSSSMIRGSAGCTDTNSNSANFSVNTGFATTVPRNSVTTANVCP